MNSLMVRMEEVKKLKNGVGIQSLLDAAYNILGNPIVMFNTEYDLLAYTQVITDDPIWNEIVTLGTFSRETLRLFENEGFIEEMANAARVAFMTSGKLKYDRMGGKVFNKNNAYVATLVLVESNKRFDENDAMVFDRICKLISKEISTSEAYEEYEQAHLETILKNLIERNYDVKLDLGQVGIIYDTLKTNLYVAVADISQCSAECTVIYFRDLFKQLQPAYKYAAYSGRVIMLMSTNDDVFPVNKRLKEILGVFEQNNMYVGISSRFENLFELQKYYMQALKALKYVLESRSNQRVFPQNPTSVDTIEQIRSLPNGRGIQYLSNLAPKILGNPVLFHDMELRLLSCTENADVNDPIWEELVTYGISSDETIEFLAAEGFFDSVEGTKAGVLLVSDKLRLNRISGKIYNCDNIMVGCLCMMENNSPFGDDVLVLFGAFCQKFSEEVGRIEFYNSYGQVYSETVISRLIDGKIDDYTFFSEDIGNIYDDLMENLYLFVVDTTQCNTGHVNLSYFRNLFNRLSTVNRYAIYANYIIIIISTDSKSLNAGKLNELNQTFEQYNIYVGISSCFENIYELRRYYNEAVDTLISGMSRNGQHGKQRIFQCKGTKHGAQNDNWVNLSPTIQTN